MVVETGSLTTEMRRNNKGTWDAIDGHPFLTDLADGSLSDRSLKWYFTQNVLYIEAAIQFVAIAAAKSPEQDARDYCVELIGIANEEIEKQRDFSAALPGGDVPTDAGMATQGYTRHLLTEAHQGGTLDVLGAFLPCPWTYEFIGNRVAPIVEHPVHKEWMEFYGSEDHTHLVDWQIAIVDRLAEGIGQAHRDRISAAFAASMRWEWMFWDEAYKQEHWPI